jgi:SIR2-like domain
MTSKLPDCPTRAEVFEFLFRSSQYGNLGLFIGAGFSRAVFSSDEDSPVLSWGPLLSTCSKKMGVDLPNLISEGTSYPDIASKLCRNYAETKSVTFIAALQELKGQICDLTAWLPSKDQRATFSDYLTHVAPTWIVTTNYDQVLECLLPGKSVSLGPFDSFSTRQGFVPIFHLHGVRTKPDSLIIAQEDYVRLFRPNTYRQIRLALAMNESTTLLLGYGLGDVNVLTALDWSMNVFTEGTGGYPHEVIQFVRKKDDPRDAPYRLSSGIVVVEGTEIADFLEDFANAIQDSKLLVEKQKAALKKLAKVFETADPSYITRFIDDNDWRRQVLEVLSAFSVNVVAEFETFFESCLTEAKKRSNVNGAFHQYGVNLHLLLDFLTAFQREDLPPALLPIVIHSFDRLSLFIGGKYGDSWHAKDVWEARKSELSPATLAELKILAKQHGGGALLALLNQA